MRWALVWPLWLSTLSWAAPGTADDAVRDLQARGALELPAGWKAGETTSVPWGRASFVRLEQQIGGVPVEGGALVLSLDPAGEVRHVRGQVAPEATVSLLPTLDRSAAIAKVDDVREWMGDGQLWPDRASVRLWFDADRRSHLVWAVELSTAAPVATWRVLVDAHS
ncbi:MAG: Zn-dependent metalloprotease, partial [Kiritimatiellia bacterium]